MRRLVHVTPHTGGGVGAAVSNLIRTWPRGDRHVVLQIQDPVDFRSLIRIEAFGGTVLMAPSVEQAKEVLKQADCLIVHWWNDRSLTNFLHQHRAIPVPTAIWSHTAHIEPVQLTKLGLRDYIVVLSSRSCVSDQALANLQEEFSPRIVPSVGDLTDFLAAYNPNRSGQIVYAGTLDFKKIHSSFLDIAAGLNVRSPKVSLIGRPTEDFQKAALAVDSAWPRTVEFLGFSQDLAHSFSPFGIFLYPLRNDHYGTSENVLLEAMAAGLVPLTLENPAERWVLSGEAFDYPRSAPNLVDLVHNDLPSLSESAGHLAEDVKSRSLYAQIANQIARYVQKSVHPGRLMQQQVDWILG